MEVFCFGSKRSRYTRRISDAPLGGSFSQPSVTITTTSAPQSKASSRGVARSVCPRGRISSGSLVDAVQKAWYSWDAAFSK